MNQQELQHEIAVLLEKVGVIIDEDLKGVEPVLSDKETITYVFFIRIAEIFKSISILFSTDADQMTSAQILLRSLSEYYILLKTSIEDDSFNNRHIKSSGSNKEKWVSDVLKHYAASGFKLEMEYFEKMKEEVRQFHDKYEKNLQKTSQLFEARNEHLIYLNVYTPACMYVHGDRQSFNIYDNYDGSVKPTAERDYSSLLRHTGLATGQIMLLSYEQFCKTIKHETVEVKRIEELLEACAGKILEQAN